MNFQKPHPLASAVDAVIQKRCTFKVMGDLDSPMPIPEDFTQRIEQAIQVAGAAPFHYPAHRIHLTSTMDSPVPWRFYALQQKDCLYLAEQLIENGEVKGKEAGLIRMLSAAGSLLLSSWLREPSLLTIETTEHRNT
jgi:hypothetical protein